MAFGRVILPSGKGNALRIKPAIDGRQAKELQYERSTLTIAEGNLSGASCTFTEASKMGARTSKKSNEKSTGGNPFQRGNTWTYIVYVPDHETGKTKQKWFGGYPTRKEALDALQTMRAQIKLGQLHLPSKETVESYIRRWFNDIHRPTIKPGTARGYEVNIRVHIVPHVGHIPLDKLTRHDVMRMCNEMHQSGLSAATVKYAYRVLSMALKEAVLNDTLPKNVCEGIKLPKGPKYKATVLNKEQAARLIQGARQTCFELEIALGVSLGLRRGEVLGLRFTDFDFEKGTVHIQNQITVVRSSKESDAGVTEWGMATLKNRVLHVPSALLEAVKDRQKRTKLDRLRYGAEYQNHGLVSCDERGRFTNPHTFYTHYKNLLRDLGLPSIRFHDLRHSYASILIEENVPLKIVSSTLGHANISTTADIYCTVINGHKAAAEKIQDCFFSAGQ